jgi:hypothetical protein
MLCHSEHDTCSPLTMNFQKISKALLEAANLKYHVGYKLASKNGRALWRQFPPRDAPPRASALGYPTLRASSVQRAWCSG